MVTVIGIAHLDIVGRMVFVRQKGKGGFFAIGDEHAAAFLPDDPLAVRHGSALTDIRQHVAVTGSHILLSNVLEVLPEVSLLIGTFTIFRNHEFGLFEHVKNLLGESLVAIGRRLLATHDDVSQRTASVQRVGADTLQTFADGQTLQTGAVLEKPMLHIRHSGRQHHLLQTATAVKYRLSHLANRQGDGDFLQISAILEYAALNGL